MIRWEEHVARNDKCIQNSVRKPWGRRLFGRPRSRWEGNIKSKSEKAVDWIHLFQDAVQWRALVIMTVTHLGSIKGIDFLDRLNDYHLLKKETARCSRFGKVSVITSKRLRWRRYTYSEHFKVRNTCKILTGKHQSRILCYVEGRGLCQREVSVEDTNWTQLPTNET